MVNAQPQPCDQKVPGLRLITHYIYIYITWLTRLSTYAHLSHKTIIISSSVTFVPPSASPLFVKDLKLLYHDSLNKTKNRVFPQNYRQFKTHGQKANNFWGNPSAIAIGYRTRIGWKARGKLLVVLVTHDESENSEFSSKPNLVFQIRIITRTYLWYWSDSIYMQTFGLVTLWSKFSAFSNWVGTGSMGDQAARCFANSLDVILLRP